MEYLISMKISIVIPVYNSSQTIAKCLESVISQTFKDYEVILIDDGSTDDSYEIVEKFINGHNVTNFTIVRQDNSGVSMARNLGIRKASGEYIAFLDSDDLWRVDKLTDQIDAFESDKNIDFLGTARNGKLFNFKAGGLKKISVRSLVYKMSFFTSTVVFKREIVEKVGFFKEDMRYSEDADFFIRIASSYNCYILNKDLVLTGEGIPHFKRSGLSSNLVAMEKGELRNLREAYKKGYISYQTHILSTIFSILKFVRRYIIVKSKV